MKVSKRWKSWLPLAGLVLAGIFGFLAVSGVDWRRAWKLVAGMQPGWLAAGTLFFLAGYAVRIVRWALALRQFNAALTVTQAAGPFLAGMAVNNIAPLRSGDFVRSFGFRRTLEMPGHAIAATLVIERVLDFIALLTIFAAGLVACLNTTAFAFVIVGPLTAVAVTALILALAVVGFPEACAARLRSFRVFLSLKPDQLAGRAFTFVDDLLISLRYFHRARLLLLLTGLSLLAWGLEGAMFLCVGKAMGLFSGAGLIAFSACWFVMAAATLATLIPSTPGHIGTFDYFGKIALMAFGFNPSTAFVFVFINHLIGWTLITSVGALVLLAYMRGRLVRVSRD